MSVAKADGTYTQIGVTSFVSSAGCASGNPDGFVRINNIDCALCSSNNALHLSNFKGSSQFLLGLDQHNNWLGSLKKNNDRIS